MTYYFKHDGLVVSGNELFPGVTKTFKIIDIGE